MKLYFEKSYFEGAKRTEPGAEEEVDMVVEGNGNVNRNGSNIWLVEEN